MLMKCLKLLVNDLRDNVLLLHIWEATFGWGWYIFQSVICHMHFGSTAVLCGSNRCWWSARNSSTVTSGIIFFHFTSRKTQIKLSCVHSKCKRRHLSPTDSTMEWYGCNPPPPPQKKKKKKRKKKKERKKERKEIKSNVRWSYSPHNKGPCFDHQSCSSTMRFTLNQSWMSPDIWSDMMAKLRPTWTAYKLWNSL